MDNILLSIVFVRKTNRFELKFHNSIEFSFASSKIEALKGHQHSAVEAVNILKKGTVIYWPELGIKIPVLELVQALLKGDTWSLLEVS